MKITIHATAIGVYFVAPPELDIEIEIPTQCPRCMVAYAERPLTPYYFDSDEDVCKPLFVLFSCPHCQSCFMAEYVVFNKIYDPCQGDFICSYPEPEPNSMVKFSDHIATLSPQFVEIYHQSQKAEFAGLNELCGMGYRKALEFLVKDFAAYSHPDKISEIENAFLGNCISTYIDNEKIKTLATASAWLGNDETHYVRKHQNYNSQDLKRFINTLVAFIEYEINYEEATNFLSNPR